MDSKTEYEILRIADDAISAAEELRAAQRAYMADRGNEELGKKVGAAAELLDSHIGKYRSTIAGRV